MGTAATNETLPTVSVVGLGKLGACTAACFAYRGFRTIGMDVDVAAVAAVNAGQPPVQEPRLAETLAAGAARLTATMDYTELIAQTDVTFLIVPTPSRENGHFSDDLLREALDGLATAFRESPKPYHLFVISSTVSPGTTAGCLIPLIEEVSGRQLHKDFGVCYSPEFIALGTVIRDFLNPDLVLIGESDTKAGDVLQLIYERVCQNSPEIVRMSLISAEIAKIGLNAYVTMKISYANTLAEICERIPGADVDAVTRALGADRRISPHGLRAGPPYGGPCFPRDNRAFAAFAADHGVRAELALATDGVNRTQAARLAAVVSEEAERIPSQRVVVLGLAYKLDTPVIDESAAVLLIDDLLRRDLTVVAYDPLAVDVARAYFGERVQYARSLAEALADAALAVVMTPAKEFAEINDAHITHNPITIIDCWRILDPRRFAKSVRYRALGSFNDAAD